MYQFGGLSVCAAPQSSSPTCLELQLLQWHLCAAVIPNNACFFIRSAWRCPFLGDNWTTGVSKSPPPPKQAVWNCALVFHLPSYFSRKFRETWGLRGSHRSLFLPQHALHRTRPYGETISRVTIIFSGPLSFLFIFIYFLLSHNFKAMTDFREFFFSKFRPSKCTDKSTFFGK